jgi:chromosome segregation ATPase
MNLMKFVFVMNHLKKVKSELENHLKKLQTTVKEAQDHLIEEQSLHETTRDLLNAAEKKISILRGEIEELRILLDRSEKARKTTELELHDSEQRLGEATSLAHRAVAERKKYEADAMQYQGEILDVRQELKIVDERARKLAADLIHRDEEIRHEREKTAESEASKRALEQQLRDCNAKIDEVEAYARAEGKRIAAKYEGRLAQLETEIDLERVRYQELLKELRRNERRIKELLSQVDEEQVKVLSLTDTLGKTNDRMRIYKSQIEGAESSAAQVLTRARRLERELDDAEQRAEVVTTTLIRSRSVHRNEY